jgi:hypothetical protein
MRTALYDLICETTEFIYIKDIGFDKGRFSVTNDAEFVVAELHENFNLGNRRIFYMDSEGNVDELLHRSGVFSGFRAGYEGHELPESA